MAREATANSGAAPHGGQFGRFYLQELINTGGMADIWLATDTKQKPYALRRMLEAVGSKVLKLVRVNLGPLTLEGLTVGKWRDLSPAEVSALKRVAGVKRKS